ncbi:MAG: cell division protein SepF [Clostridiales bacterium]|nr:cell division protein SepF [Clostridiales bacterium]
MGFLDELKRIARPYEDEEEDDETLDDFDTMGTGRLDRTAGVGRMDRTAGKEKPAARQQDNPAVYDTERRSNKVVNIHTTTQLQVVLVKPDRFENAAEIADHLRDKRTVVLNLESTNKDIARRLLDFLSGVAYAQEGKIKKVAISTYIITPYNVDILGNLLDELEDNGLYF